MASSEGVDLEQIRKGLLSDPKYISEQLVWHIDKGIVLTINFTEILLNLKVHCLRIWGKSDDISLLWRTNGSTCTTSGKVSHKSHNALLPEKNTLFINTRCY